MLQYIKKEGIVMLNMPLPSDVLYIIDRMRSHGYSAHVVGGSVRDSLIGRELGDFDITTDALPQDTKAAFSEHKTVDTGIKHGTVTLVLGGVPYEITTYRVDGDYKDNRHPESVTFTRSLREDLARRDFTVNAMAYSPDGGLVDPFGGREDAAARIIRAVGDPYRRFDEDALRILRALRFASVLDFEIEEKTSEAIRSLAERLVSISKERIYTELKKLISGENAYEILRSYSGVLSFALDGMHTDVLPQRELFDRADYLTRLSALIYLNSTDPADAAERILSSLKTDKLTRTYVISAINAYGDSSLRDERDALISLARHGVDAVEAALRLGVLLGRFTEMESGILAGALASDKPYAISHLAIRGTDITALGIEGARVGEVLKSLLFAVIDGEVENSKEGLISHVMREIATK